MDSNAPNNYYIDCYYTLFQGLGKVCIDCGITIAREDYQNYGYTFYAFDLTPDYVC